MVKKFVWSAFLYINEPGTLGVDEQRKIQTFECSAIADAQDFMNQ